MNASGGNMSRWRALPAELDPRVRQLVVRLRRLKDHSGLSVRQLAARTGYSPKSWERYLGARSLPPRQAVEALARIGGEDPTRLLALQEVAAEALGRGRDTAAVAEVTVAEPELTSPGPGEQVRIPTRSLRVALVAGAVTLVLAVSSAVLVTVRLMDRGGDGQTAEGRRSPPPHRRRRRRTPAVRSGSAATGTRATAGPRTPVWGTAAPGRRWPRRSVCCGGPASHRAVSTGCSGR